MCYWAAIQRRRARLTMEECAALRTAMHGDARRYRAFIRRLTYLGKELDRSMGLVGPASVMQFLGGFRLRRDEDANERRDDGIARARPRKR